MEKNNISLSKLILIFSLIGVQFSLQAHNMVCFKTGLEIPAQQLAQLNCMYHTMIIANADDQAQDIDPTDNNYARQQSGTYQCYINFDVGTYIEEQILLVDEAFAKTVAPENLLPAHIYTAPDGKIITPFVYFRNPPMVRYDPINGFENTLVNVLKLWNLTTTQIANALNLKAPVVYSNYSPLVIRNLAREIKGVFGLSPTKSTIFIPGCKISY